MERRPCWPCCCWMAVLAVLVVGAASPSTSALLTIEPTDPVARSGQTLRLTCRARAPIKSCLWEVNKELLTDVDSDDRFVSHGRWADGECGLSANMSAALSGQWACRALILGVNERAFKATTNVTLLVVPQVWLEPSSDPITVVAGQPARIRCVVGQARPAPTIQWMIGDRQLNASSRTTETDEDDQGLMTINETLTHTFQAADAGDAIRCRARAPWLDADDVIESSARLDVLYPAQSKEPLQMTGLVAGQAVNVAVNFTANPRPVRVYWNMEDDTQLSVVPYDIRASTHDRFDVMQLKEMDSNWYEARLRLRTLDEADAGRIFRLTVESDVDGRPQTMQYLVQISEVDRDRSVPSRLTTAVYAPAPTSTSTSTTTPAPCPCRGCLDALTSLRLELEKIRDNLDVWVEQMATLEAYLGYVDS